MNPIASAPVGPACTRCSFECKPRAPAPAPGSGLGTAPGRERGVNPIASADCQAGSASEHARDLAGADATVFCHCIRPRKRAVLLLNLGTPDSTEAADVRRYLREFLSDPFVINLPQRWSWFTPILGRLIARFRARKSAEAYASIWWDEGSPLKVITQRQEQALGQLLGGGWQVYHAMRYANPSIADTLRRIARDMVTDLVVIPMYPQWAGPTTGTALEVLYREMRRQGLRLSVTVRGEWYNDRAYLDAQARLIARFAGERDLNPRNSFLLFSTHSMPVSYIKEGDPYEGQVRESVELVRHLLNWPADRMALSFQSKLGPVPWLGPGTDKALEKLAADGEKNVLVCPISFTADCLETLEEIGEGYAHEFSEASKGGRLHLIPALNEDALFIRCLEGLTRRGPQPVHQRDMAAGSIAIERPPSLPTLLPRLLVVGMATPGQLETDNPRHFTDAQTLRCARQSKGDIHRLLRRIGRHALVDGGMMLHTCQRSEAIILLREPAPDASEWSSLVRLIFPDHADADLPALRTLTGVEAYRRLLRTAMGLNSILPGDADVIEQMLSGGRMAEHAGTLSPGLAVLLRHIEDTVRTISRQSAWGEFMTDFCHAAVHDLGIPTDAQCTESVILGGSVTCRQILKRLTHDGGRGGDRLTFVHRGTGGKELLHFLRTTAPNARQIRVHRYDEPLVREAISNADVVYIGIDRREPVLRAEHLIGPRDFARRPLRIIDFNSHGSTVGMDSIEGVELITAKTLLGAAMRFGGQVIERPGFTAAFGEVERWIEDLIGEHSSEVPPSIERACCPDAREASELSEVTA